MGDCWLHTRLGRFGRPLGWWPGAGEGAACRPSLRVANANGGVCVWGGGGEGLGWLHTHPGLDAILGGGTADGLVQVRGGRCGGGVERR
jgi:hypothetical protein